MVYLLKGLISLLPTTKIGKICCNIDLKVSRTTEKGVFTESQIFQHCHQNTKLDSATALLSFRESIVQQQYKMTEKQTW